MQVEEVSKANIVVRYQIDNSNERIFKHEYKDRVKLDLDVLDHQLINREVVIPDDRNDHDEGALDGFDDIKDDDQEPWTCSLGECAQFGRVFFRRRTGYNHR